MSSPSTFVCLLSAALVAGACTGDSQRGRGGGGGGGGGTPSPDGGAAVEDSGGAAAADAQSADATDPGPPDAGMQAPDIGGVAGECAQLGLTRQPFLPGATTYNFGDVAGDFTVNTVDGAWRLADRWSGCDSYTFINYIPTNGNDEENLWRSRVQRFVDDTQLNAHFFFLSWEADAAARRARVQEIKTKIDTYLQGEFVSQTLIAQHQARFHYVTDAPPNIQGSVGAFANDYIRYAQDPANRVDLGNRGMLPPPLPYFFAIDREQKWDPGGNVRQTVGGTADFRMATYLPMFFDHKASIRDAQAAETGVTKITLLQERVTDRIFTKTVTLPSAEEMATFDTLEFDITVNCPHRNVFACSEWDRNAYIHYCLDEMCTERRELVRWITPYWRRGERRWVIDASALISLIDAGGPQTFRIVMGPGFERKTERDATFVLRLSNQGRAERSVGAERAFTGGGFNANYNTRDPFTFTPPATASKVELVVILSGHGQADSTNCAEWCDHRHQFVINGQSLPEIRHRGQIGSAGGCGPSAAQGVPPGQFGNWAPERAYWCPGLPVDHKRYDITGQVNLGAENSLVYSANLAGRAPGGGNIDLSAYVVWSQ